MDPVVLYAAYRHFVNKKRKRRCSAYPINNARYSDGGNRNLYGLLREHDDKFFNYLRMSISSFDELVVKFKETNEIRPELMRGLAFSVEEMLTISLRMLSSPRPPDTSLGFLKAAGPRRYDNLYFFLVIFRSTSFSKVFGSILSEACSLTSINVLMP
ncbi:hypothetical protein J6590_077753 [Homalodisca vitripennis]|nr:hypothetical protein J6590_077753 [Homalodisca vitripennis]